MKCYEVNFDSLVGPTHNYGGLAYGNMASYSNQLSMSNPQQAALQGLEKMKFLHSLGIKQGIIPPHPRPHLASLRQIGFQGEDHEVFSLAWQQSPQIAMAVTSAAYMWAANSATVAPSIDSQDGRVQITSANLHSKFHRSIEASFTARLLKRIFADPLFFKHHPPLPCSSYFSDEGAANHTCFNESYGKPGVHLFVYGKQGFSSNMHAPSRFPARQTLEASQAIARLHQLNPQSVLFFQQTPGAVDHGVFHNDVIAVGNNNVFFYHEKAYWESEASIERLKKAVQEVCQTNLLCIPVKQEQIPLEDAVRSYLFNSQLITLPDHSMALITPSESRVIPTVFSFLNELKASDSNPINHLYFLNLRESMRNGGGPACLRLRVILTDQEFRAVSQKFIFNEKLYSKLVHCITKHYPTELTLSELRKPSFFSKVQEALLAIYEIFEISDEIIH